MLLDNGGLTGLMDKAINILTFDWLTGPIFDRELRACSRRKRYYLLRIIFIALLLLFFAWTWMMTMTFASSSGSPAFRTMRTSIVSRGVVAAVVWLEFITMPLLATVMLSDSISREINKRTLEILLSTPITSLQIVMGKFFGSLLQLLLLTGLTLPLFAIIRVLGGVPWDFITISLCITLTTTCLFGAMSLYYSIRTRQSYKVIGWILFTGLFVFGLLPGLISALNQYRNWQWLPKASHSLEIVNPFLAMVEITTSVMTSNPQGASVFNWGLHCLIITLVFLAVILLSTIRLRKTMLNLSANRVGGASKIRKIRAIFTKNKSDAVSSRGIIEVSGNPILWKELRMGESEHLIGSQARRIVWVSVIVVVYFCAAFFEVLTNPVFHAILVTVLALFAFLRTAALSALSISKEKQSRTWPILLTTPIEDREILKMKTKAILRKTAFFWIVIFGDVLVFSICLVLSPVAILGVAIAIIPTILFLVGVGAYFGMRLKTTTGAMAATFSVPIVLWLLCPCSINFSPLALIAMSVGIGMEEEGWMFSLIMMGVNLIPAVVYGVAGFIFLLLAKSSMRKYIFNVSG